MTEAEKPRDLRLPAALVRTALSSEQTLMSWVRTSLSLLTFGFSNAQFFRYLDEQMGTASSAGPRRLGIALVVVGVIALIAAIAEHVVRVRRLRDEGLPPDSGSFLPVGSAAVLLVIGVTALVSLFLGWQL